jgi:hypothetical protein
MRFGGRARQYQSPIAFDGEALWRRPIVVA